MPSSPTLPAPELARLSWRFDDEVFNKGNLAVVEELTWNEGNYKVFDLAVAESSASG